MELGKGEAQSFFEKKGVQLGVSVPDGVSTAARLAQLFLEANPKEHVVLKTDFKNAFNNIPRHLVLDQLFKQPSLSRFYRMVHWTYSAPSRQFVRGASGIEAVIMSCEGVRQGCVFGSLGYAIATLEMFLQVRDQHPGVLVVAILDDLCLAGKPADVFPAFDTLNKLASERNIPIQFEKCEVLMPKEETASVTEFVQRYQFKQAKGILPLLGTVVGLDTNLKMNWIRSKIQSWQPIFDILASEDIPSQVSLLITRWMGTAKPNFLARSLPPVVSRLALEWLDKATQKCVEKRLDLTFEKFSDFMLHLPFSQGGVGLTKAANLAANAFVASVATTLRHLANTPLDRAILKTLPTFNKQLQRTLTQLNENGLLHEDIPPTVDKFIAKFAQANDTSGLQKKLNEKMYEETVGKQLKDDFTHEENFHYESRQTPLAAAAFKAHPFTSEFVLTNEETRFMVAHATCCKPNEMPTLCSCGQPLSLSHATSCGPNQLTRHNRLQARFVAIAREQGCTIEQNVRLDADDAKKQLEPDIIFYFGWGAPVETDVTVVNPNAPSYVARSKRPVAGAAMAIAEGRKGHKYEHAAYRRGRHFMPLAFETQGRASEHILALLKRIAAHTEPGTGLAVGDMMMDLQMTLVRGNAACAQTVLARAERAEDRLRGVHYPIPHTRTHN
jgi:hypothetical protein